MQLLLLKVIISLEPHGEVENLEQQRVSSRIVERFTFYSQVICPLLVDNGEKMDSVSP
jgi:hypothetical protein